ncbi:hypothetical protein MRX96_045361 [Rhipicephalus microplus]
MSPTGASTAEPGCVVRGASLHPAFTLLLPCLPYKEYGGQRLCMAVGKQERSCLDYSKDEPPYSSRTLRLLLTHGLSTLGRTGGLAHRVRPRRREPHEGPRD